MSGKCVFSFGVHALEVSTLFNMPLFVHFDLSFLFAFLCFLWVILGYTVLFDIVPVWFFLIPQM